MRNQCPLVAPQRAQEATYNGRISHAGEVFGLRLFKRSCEVLSGISVSTTRSDGVAEDPPSMCPGAMRGFYNTALFQLPQRSQQHGGGDVRNRQIR
ncbi:hypothetical protein D3C73_1249780 [compost metagenome]